MNCTSLTIFTAKITMLLYNTRKIILYIFRIFLLQVTIFFMIKYKFTSTFSIKLNKKPQKRGN
jgi:hypothetical protein